MPSEECHLAIEVTVTGDLKRKAVFLAIENERRRQIVKWSRASSKVEDPATDPLWKLAVLGEEYGEVSKELIEGANRAKLAKELTHTAAVCTAWLESLLCLFLLLWLTGCTIPVVGNSPEEMKHRKQLEQGQFDDQKQ